MEGLVLPGSFPTIGCLRALPALSAGFFERGNTTTMKKHTLVIFRDRRRQFRWHIKAKGRIVASSAGDGYKRLNTMASSLVNLIADLRGARSRQEMAECGVIVDKAITDANLQPYRPC